LFADGQLTDVLRNMGMGNDLTIEPKVKKKLIRILASWNAQYKDDPSMKTAANLYKQHKTDTRSVWRPEAQIPRNEELEAAKRKSKDEARQKAREEREASERLKREEKKKKREAAGKPKPKRKPFNFEEVF
jgi:hypothetical protein